MNMRLAFVAVFTIFSSVAMGQYNENGVSKMNPFGKVHPESPEQVKDFDKMIGRSKCVSFQNNQNGVFQDTVQMVWEFKYILNGRAVQDETWKSDGRSATSIRVYNPDSAKWYVTYYSTLGYPPAPTVWDGKMEGSDIVLWTPQKAPNGLDGYSRLTFYEIKEESFRWKGEWVDTNKTIVFPFWLIDCEKIQ